MIDRICLPAPCNQMKNYFRVRSRLENCPLILHPLSDVAKVGKVPIVCNCDAAPLVEHIQGLDIESIVRRPGGGVSIVADCNIAFEKVGEDSIIFVHIVHKPEILVNVEAVPAGSLVELGSDDSRAFLSAMLLREKSIVGKLCGSGVAIDAKDSTMASWLVNFREWQCQRSRLVCRVG